MLLKSGLVFEGCNYGLIENPVDLLYLTGIPLSTGSLVIEPDAMTLFVDGRYYESAQKKMDGVVLNENGVLQEKLKNKRVMIDSAWTTVERYERLKSYGCSLHAKPQLLKELRSIKDEHERKALKKSAKLLWKAYEHIRKKLKTGVSEQELAEEFERYGRKHGATGVAFEPIIAFGKNSAMPHYRAGSSKLKKNDLVLLDLGLIVDQYHSDMTRVVFRGKPHPELYRLYTIVRAAHAAALAMAKPGVRVKELDIAARKVFQQHHVESLFVHALGHGIGLETHEYPRIRFSGEDADVMLQPHMAITIEPGLYVPGLGGIRYEDTILITENGYENLYPTERVL